jgi:hypothetical protein
LLDRSRPVELRVSVELREEVMRLCSNLPGGFIRLQRARLDATSEEGSPDSPAPRLHMKRLDVAQRFGVHRTTVTCLLSDAMAFSFGRSACLRASSVTPPGSTGRAGHWRSSATNSAWTT